MADSALGRVVDGLDIETFLLCENEEEGRNQAFLLMKELGFLQADVIFCEYIGMGVRVRMRAVMNKPCHHYSWLPE